MQTVLITGANRGIGLEHARAYASRGVRVYATARAPEEADALQGLAATHKDAVTILSYEAADPDAAKHLRREIGDGGIDLMLANAGIIGGKKQSFGAIDYDDLAATFQVDAIAPLRLAEAFADNVVKSKRRLMAFQSSLMGSIDDNGSGGYYGYRIAKVALNMIARGVARDLGGRGVISLALHPGWVQTRMGGSSATVSVERCVAGQQKIFEDATREHSGRFFNFDGRELPW